MGTSPEFQGLRFRLPVQRLWLHSLVRELRCHRPGGQKNQNIYQKQYCNKSNKDFKNEKWFIAKKNPKKQKTKATVKHSSSWKGTLTCFPWAQQPSARPERRLCPPPPPSSNLLSSLLWAACCCSGQLHTHRERGSSKGRDWTNSVGQWVSLTRTPVHAQNTIRAAVYHMKRRGARIKLNKIPCLAWIHQKISALTVLN